MKKIIVLMLSALVLCVVSCSKKLDYDKESVDNVIKSAMSAHPSQATYTKVMEQQEVVIKYVSGVFNELEECSSVSEVEALEKKYESDLKVAEKQMQEMNGILSGADLDKDNQRRMKRLEDIQRQLVMRMLIIGEKTKGLD